MLVLGGADEHDFRIRLALEAFNNNKIIRLKMPDQVRQRRFPLLHDRRAPWRDDGDGGSAGLAVAVCIGSFPVDLEAVDIMLDDGNAKIQGMQHCHKTSD